MNQQPKANYKAFAMDLWGRSCDKQYEFSRDEILATAINFGIVTAEVYNPDIHGERLGNAWGIEKGDYCYIATEAPETPSYQAAAMQDMLSILERLEDWDKAYPKGMIHTMVGEKLLDYIIEDAKTALDKYGRVE